MMQPLIALAMIVKNEARSIAKTLASVQGAVDYIFILDTGSTDGTPDIAWKAFGSTPGHVGYAEFKDFATTRNAAIELAEQTGAKFVLMLSGNETLLGDVKQLREFCLREYSGSEGGYAVMCKMGEFSYSSNRLSRSGAGWHYYGVTHEVMTGPAGEIPAQTVPGVHIFHDVSERSIAEAKVRWQKDVELLTRAMEADPTNTRTVFYLAQSYEMLKEHTKAEYFYRKRVQMGGWQEEVFISLLRIGRNMRDAGRDWALVQNAFLQAHGHTPTRAEPLYELGEHYYKDGKHALAYLFFTQAAKLSPPENVLFSEPALYKHCVDRLGVSAWYTGHYEEGEDAVRRALKENPNDQRLHDNLVHYENRKKPPRKLTDDLDVEALRARLGTSKVVVSITTIPSRWHLLQKALTSLLTQRFMPDEILVVVPPYSQREKTKYVIPEWLKKMEKAFVHVRVLNVDNDYGPASKLFGALQAHQEPDTIIATFDDDIEYEEHVLEKLVDRAIRYPNAAIGFSGINVEKLIREGSYELVYEQFGRRPQDPTPANIVEGYCGVAYRRSFFQDDIYDISGFPSDVMFVDDFWFGGYLARKGIPKLIFHYSDLTLTREEVWFRIWKQYGLNTDSNPLHLLPNFVEKNRRVAVAFKAQDSEIWIRELDLKQPK
jgi:glycosyltransferase involved in cell wall biosynthesis